MIIDIAENKKKFIQYVKTYIKRDGVQKLLEWLDTTDFYVAPASTQYHLCVEGGLCQHSLDVFENMINLCVSHYGEEFKPDVVFNGQSADDKGAFGMENIAIVALFHDLCKVGCYVKDFKNVKVDGRWVQQEYWRWDDKFVYGRGAKSVFIIQQFIRLYTDEAQAIRFHTAGHEDPLNDVTEKSYMQVFDKLPLAVFLYLADVIGTYIDGKETE
jgi:hypothetical protein